MKTKWTVLGASHIFLLASVLHLAQGCTAAKTPKPAQNTPARPNIVLIMADDLGFSDLGCYGSEISTPNLDKMAASGVRMTQFYTTPRCCPTRASILTGVYSHQAGIGDMMQDRGVPGYRGEISQNCLTVAEELKRADYRTLMVGKWHTSHIFFDGKKQLNGESDVPFWDNKDQWPLQRGFEDYYGTIHGVNSYYDPFSLTEGNTPIKSVPTNYYYTDAISDRAVANIDKYAGGDKPFFLYVAYTAPHWPLHAAPEEIQKYRDTYMAGWDVLRTNRYERQIQMGIIDKSWPLPPRDARVPDWNTVRDKEWEATRMATYAAMVERMDKGIGRIMAELKKKGVDKNTLVVFLSDNGACDEAIQTPWYDVPTRTRDGRPVKIGNNNHSVFAGPDDVWQSYGPPWANLSDTPLRLYKHFTHEGGISTPLIAYWPNQIKNTGSISSEIGHIIDIVPTFVDISGAKHPQSVENRVIVPLEGISLMPVLQEGTKLPARPIFWEHEGNRAVRMGPWKLVSMHGHDWELYNVAEDRSELKNLATVYPERVNEMATLYENWAKRCNVLPRSQLPAMIPTIPAAVSE